MPWLAASFASSGEYVIGTFPLPLIVGGPQVGISGFTQTIVVTNLAVYVALTLNSLSSQIQLVSLNGVYAWGVNDINQYYLYPGQAVSFIAVNGIVYFTGLMLLGVYAIGAIGGGQYTFQVATYYVAGRFIGELAGRLVVSECSFPGGGGTGTAVLPTVAWSGVGIFGQAWDGNPAHDVWNAVNLNYFNGNIGGFNLLGDVPDQITGMGTVGQSIIIVRQNGITQQDPNSTFSNSGIQPFNWYHMWASPQGVGGYVGTVAQFGQALTFRSDDNVYTLSLSGGLTAIGTKIIPKIMADQKMTENLPSITTVPAANFKPFWTNYWNFASIYNLDGQLHYLLTASGLTTNPSAIPTSNNTFAYAYDLNMSDGSWHFWDFSQYYQQSGAGAGFLGFSCPLTLQSNGIIQVQHFPPTTGINVVAFPQFMLFGGFTSYIQISGELTGTLLQLVPYDYDFNSKPITNYLALLYAPLSVPSTSIFFRGETLSLGHKISTRRLRIQADNAPMPTLVANAQEQAIVKFYGANSYAQSPTLNMQGNLAPTGLAIQTYYGDAILSDEMIQPSLMSVFSATAPWQTLCAFRIASASLIGIDATGSTQ